MARENRNQSGTGSVFFNALGIAPQLQILLLALNAGLLSPAQPVDSAGEHLPSPPPSATSASPFNEDRILRVMPDYQTVRDSSQRVSPLTGRQK
jgi:hypothetical protein